MLLEFFRQANFSQRRETTSKNIVRVISFFSSSSKDIFFHCFRERERKALMRERNVRWLLFSCSHPGGAGESAGSLQGSFYKHCRVTHVMLWLPSSHQIAQSRCHRKVTSMISGSIKSEGPRNCFEKLLNRGEKAALTIALRQRRTNLK